jgi:hypothetical protein
MLAQFLHRLTERRQRWLNCSVSETVLAFFEMPTFFHLFSANFFFFFLGPEFRFWALKTYFCLYDPPKIYFFLLHLKFSIDGYIILILGPYSVFGLWRLNSPFWPPKVWFFLLHVKLLNDGCITRSYWFWAPNPVFGF